jgi:hypothetical protein
MSDMGSSPSRRSFLAASPAAGTAAGDAIRSKPSNQGDLPMGTTKTDAIRPFTINIPEEEVADLRRRIAATQWPERETVADATQGVQLATMQKLARYWSTEYD